MLKTPIRGKTATWSTN